MTGVILLTIAAGPVPQASGGTATASGQALVQQGTFESAEAALRKAVRLRPDLPEAHYVLGVVLWQTRRAPEAADAFRAALARRPAYADAHYMLGTVLRQIGKVDEALTEFQAHYQLALALTRFGGREQVRQPHMDEARRLAPALVPPDAK